MRRGAAVRPSDARGVSRLAIDATEGLTAVVEAMHQRIARAASVPDTPVHVAAREMAGLVYRTVRGMTRLVGDGLDGALAGLEPLLDRGGTSPRREAILAALNGVLGDHLVETGNPLAIPMRLRRLGRPLDPGPALAPAIPDAGGRLLVLVHGLCMNDLQWSRDGHDHGAALARDLGYTVVHLHYNTGLHISLNGRGFADLMESLVRHWPVPLSELAILAHSMGGLVARSAVHQGTEAGQAWPQRLRRLVFLGTPHHGAPLERGGNWIELLLGVSSWTAPLARIGQIRSAGVTDLRHGSLLEEDWAGRHRFSRCADGRVPVPLPEGVACHAIAGTTRKRPAPSGKRRPPGDGLVPVASALGRHPERRRSLRIPPARRWLAYGAGHFQLLGSPEVYAKVREWLG